MSRSMPIRVAKRYYEAASSMTPALVDVMSALKNAEAWITRFPQVLSAAQHDATETPGGLQPGEVWQDRFVEYWRAWDEIEDRLRVLADKLDDVYLGMTGGRQRDNLGMLIGAIWSMTKSDRTSKSKTNYAFQEPKFRTHPTRKPHHIAYEVKRLTDWARHFEKWVGETLVKTKAASR